MNGRSYDELESWEKAFYDLNMKIGNEAWGARLEGDGTGKNRMRVFVNDEEMKDLVLKETNGSIDGHSLVFTVWHQAEYAKVLQRQRDEADREEAEELADDELEIEIVVEEDEDIESEPEETAS